MRWFRSHKEHQRRYLENLLLSTPQALLADGRIAEAFDLSFYMLNVQQKPSEGVAGLINIVDQAPPLSNMRTFSANTLSQIFFIGGYSPSTNCVYNHGKPPCLSFYSDNTYYSGVQSVRERPNFIEYERDIVAGVHYASIYDTYREVIETEPVTPQFFPAYWAMRGAADRIAIAYSNWPIDALLYAASKGDDTDEIRLGRCALYGITRDVAVARHHRACETRDEFIYALSLGGYFPKNAPQGKALIKTSGYWVPRAVYRRLRNLPASDTVQALLTDALRAIAGYYVTYGTLYAGENGIHLDEAFDWFNRLRARDAPLANEHERCFRGELVKSKTSIPESELSRLAARTIPGPRADLAPYKKFCESPAEITLLAALLEQAQLAPTDRPRTLAGAIEVQLQAQIANIRVDFLVDRSLVVEVDGRAYHSESQRFEEDRYRDQTLTLKGYRILRFPAKQVFADAAGVADMVLRAAAM